MMLLLLRENMLPGSDIDILYTFIIENDQRNCCGQWTNRGSSIDEYYFVLFYKMNALTVLYISDESEPKFKKKNHV